MQKTLQAVDHEAAGLSGARPGHQAGAESVAGRKTREIQNRWRTPMLKALLPKPLSELLPTVYVAVPSLLMRP